MSWLDRLKQWLKGPEIDFGPVVPVHYSEEHYRWKASGSVDYEKTRGVYVFREDRDLGVKIRIFVSGNRSLRRVNDFPHDDYEDEGCMTREQYSKLQQGLLELMYPEGHVPVPRDSKLDIYQNYIAVQEPWIEGVKSPDLMDNDTFLRPALALLQEALGWEEMPEIQATGAYGPPQSDDGEKHWVLGRR